MFYETVDMFVFVFRNYSCPIIAVCLSCLPCISSSSSSSSHHYLCLPFSQQPTAHNSQLIFTIIFLSPKSKHIHDHPAQRTCSQTLALLPRENRNCNRSYGKDAPPGGYILPFLSTFGSQPQRSPSGTESRTAGM